MYTIHHGSGATERQVNQQQSSAGLVRLGLFAMKPGQNHRVEVEGALEGERVADGIRFIIAGTSTLSIRSVHAGYIERTMK